MANLLASMMSEADANALHLQLQESNKVLKPFFSNLSAKQRTGLRSMGKGREGVVRLISKIALAHPDALSRQDDPQELVQKLLYQSLAENWRQQALITLESITEIQNANGHDIMRLFDIYSNALQVARLRDSALDLEMQEVDEYNKRFANLLQEEEETDAPVPPVTPEP